LIVIISGGMYKALERAIKRGEDGKFVKQVYIYNPCFSIMIFGYINKISLLRRIEDGNKKTNMGKTCIKGTRGNW
jgi:hypothetical protein